jgi:anti-sigma regulatory factor (Ser/Thr protein kinase)
MPTSQITARLARMCPATSENQIRLPTDPTASARARRFLEAARCPVHNTAVLDEALLMVSELVANAVSHGGPPVSVKVSCNASDGMEVRVSDGSERMPEPGEPEPTSENGRGLYLVDVLSSRWGVEPTEDGKEVWFLLRPE